MSDLERLAREIYGCGITDVFGIPGSGQTLELLDCLEQYPVKFHLAHFEGAAAIMAGVAGRLSGRPGVAVSIKGPGLANMIPGLALCYLERFPLVAIAEAYHAQAPPSQAHKRMNHAALVEAVTKGRRYLAERGPGFTEMAEWAAAEIPGPVLLELAGGKTERECGVPPATCPAGADLVKYISRAKRPLVIAGTLALRYGWSDQLNRLSIPVFSTVAVKGVINEHLPHAAGVYTGAGLELTPEKNVLPMADLIVGIGLHPNEVLAARPFHCPAVNIYPVDDPGCAAAFNFAATAPPREAAAVFDALARQSWGLEAVQASRHKLEEKLLGGPFLPARAFRIIEDAFQGAVRLVLDTGNFCTVGEHVWRSIRGDRFLCSGQGRYMGVSLPMGLAASLYDRQIPTVVVAGDGGIGPFLAEMKIAVQNRLPLILILMTDGYFASIRGRALRDRLTEKPLTIAAPSWLSVMEGFRLRAERVEMAEALHRVLAEWNIHEGPMYIEIPFPATPYQWMLRGIR
ncbi:MAG: thiamine pyrophosphate-binding protein [Firmicutes bacterium]|nr:thiamine pyrophosphate-binding protein [Bacillota bacterium]